MHVVLVTRTVIESMVMQINDEDEFDAIDKIRERSSNVERKCWNRSEGDIMIDVTKEKRRPDYGVARRFGAPWR